MTTKRAPKPPIDRSAEDAVEKAGPAPAMPAADTDTPMPTVENEAPFIFRPGSGIGTADVIEITLMYVLELCGSQAQCAPGALRSIALSAARTGQLSESARRFMQAMEAPPQAEQPTQQPPQQLQ